MRSLLIFLVLFIYGYTSQETMQDAASYARWIVSNEVEAVVSTFDNGTLFPYGTKEDFCEHWRFFGVPFFLLNMESITAENLAKNAMTSVSIAVRNCSIANYADWPYDGNACYRITLLGWLLEYTFNRTEDIQKFYQCHPAIAEWTYDLDFFFFELLEVRYIGGYPNVHWSGVIDTDVYLKAQSKIPPFL